jgi:hypothetical protein
MKDFFRIPLDVVMLICLVVMILLFSVPRPAFAAAPTISVQPTSQAVDENDDVTLSVTATSHTSIQWYKNAATTITATSRITGVTTTTLSIKNIQLTDPASIYAKLTNADGSTTTSRAILTITPRPINDGKIKIPSSSGRGLQIGTGGDYLTLVYVGQVQVDNGHTSQTVVLRNARAGDIPLLAPATSLGSAAKYYSTVTTGSLAVILNADPGANVKMNYLLLRKRE